MGLTIILEDENGQVIRTLPKEWNYEELENIELDKFTLLKYLDFYGDTTFNTLQLHDLQSDFKRLKLLATSQGDTIDQILDLISESQRMVHTYIKFYGD